MDGKYSALEKNQLMLEAEKKSFWSCYKICMATQEGGEHKTARKIHEANGPQLVNSHFTLREKRNAIFSHVM